MQSGTNRSNNFLLPLASDRFAKIHLRMTPADAANGTKVLRLLARAMRT